MMTYQYAVTRTDQYKKLREMSEANRRSAELWKLMSECCSPVPMGIYVPDKYRLRFVTLIRSVWDNRIVVYGDKLKSYLRGTTAIIEDQMTSFDEACMLNAHKALTNTLIIDNPGMQSRLAESAMQVMGVVFHDDCIFVYLNVLVKDDVLDLVQDGEAHLDSGSEIIPIQKYTPVPSTLEATLWDSVVIVNEVTDNE